MSSRRFESFYNSPSNIFMTHLNPFEREDDLSPLCLDASNSNNWEESDEEKEDHNAGLEDIDSIDTAEAGAKPQDDDKSLLFAQPLRLRDKIQKSLGTKPAWGSPEVVKKQDSLQETPPEGKVLKISKKKGKKTRKVERPKGLEMGEMLEKQEPEDSKDATVFDEHKAEPISDAPPLAPNNDDKEEVGDKEEVVVDKDTPPQEVKVDAPKKKSMMKHPHFKIKSKVGLLPQDVGTDPDRESCNDLGNTETTEASSKQRSKKSCSRLHFKVPSSISKFISLIKGSNGGKTNLQFDQRSAPAKELGKRSTDESCSLKAPLKGVHKISHSDTTQASQEVKTRNLTKLFAASSVKSEI